MDASDKNGRSKSLESQAQARATHNQQGSSGGIPRTAASGSSKRTRPVYSNNENQAKGNKPRKAKTRNQGKKGIQGAKAKIIMTVIVAVVAVAFAGTSLAAYFVGSGDTIYPGVTLDGIDIGGLTPKEAARKLENSGYGGYEGKEVSIAFPMNHSLTISAEEAGVSGKVDEAAEAAYEYGREGNIFSNLFSYMGTKSKGQEVSVEKSFNIDKEYVLEQIDTIVKDVNADLIDRKSVV